MIYMQSVIMYAVNTYEKLKSILNKLDISPSTQETYLLCLSKGPLKSQEIAKITKQPRQTVMTNLKKLRDIGLCEVTPMNQKIFQYTMLAPSRLRAYLGSNLRDINETLTEIESLDIEKSVLSVKSVSGQKDVQKLLDLALYCKERKWWIASPYENAVRFMPKSYQQYFVQVRTVRQIQSLSLWNQHISQHSLHLREQLMRKPRYVPESQDRELEAMTIIFDDTVVIIEGSDNPSAVVIESQAISQTMKLLFEMAWVPLRKGSGSAS